MSIFEAYFATACIFVMFGALGFTLWAFFTSNPK